MRAWMHKYNLRDLIPKSCDSPTLSIKLIVIRELQHFPDTIHYLVVGDLFEEDNIVVERRYHSDTIINLTLTI